MAHETEQIIGVMHKLMAVVHALVFAVGLLDAKNARDSSETRCFDRPMERKKTEPNKEESDRSEQSEVNGGFSIRLGVQKVVFRMQNVMG